MQNEDVLIIDALVMLKELIYGVTVISVQSPVRDLFVMMQQEKAKVYLARDLPAVKFKVRRDTARGQKG